MAIQDGKTCLLLAMVSMVVELILVCGEMEDSPNGK
jgi:hypothetical protein